MTDANHTILTINCNATAQFALGLTWTMLFIYPLRLAEADIAVHALNRMLKLVRSNYVPTA